MVRNQIPVAGVEAAMEVVVPEGMVGQDSLEFIMGLLTCITT